MGFSRWQKKKKGKPSVNIVTFISKMIYSMYEEGNAKTQISKYAILIVFLKNTFESVYLNKCRFND